MARQEGNTDRRGCLHDLAPAQPHSHFSGRGQRAVQADMEVTR